MRFLLFVASSIITTSVAAGADLPARSSAPPLSVAPVFTWTGLYVGLNAGYAFNGDHSYTLTTGDNGSANPGGLITGVRPTTLLLRSDGFTGGGQIGYNYQFGGLGPGNIVAGVEADIAYTDLSRSGPYIARNGEVSNFSASTDYVGTVRGRLGYAFDTLMIYGTGGFAYGGVRDDFSFLNGVGRPIYIGDRSTTRAGYVYGGGAEYAIPAGSALNVLHFDNISVKGEFVHYDLGTGQTPIPNTTGIDSGYIAHTHTAGNIVRAGINYKFNSFGGAGTQDIARF